MGPFKYKSYKEISAHISHINGFFTLMACVKMFKQSKARADVNKQCPFNDCDTLLTAVPAWLDRIAISVRQTETQL